MRRAVCVMAAACLLAGLLGCVAGELVVEAEATTEVTTTTTTTTARPELEPEPFEQVITQRIHPDMPEFTFTAHGIRGSQWGATVETIEIEGEGFHQRIEHFEEHEEWHSQRTGGGHIRLDDFNNDGYLDIQVILWQAGTGSLAEQSLFFLWNPRLRQFVLHEQLGTLTDAASVARPALDEHGRLQTWARGTRGGWGYYYEYRNGQFVLVEVNGFEHHIDGDYIVRREYGLVNGEITLLREIRLEDVYD